MNTPTLVFGVMVICGLLGVVGYVSPNAGVTTSAQADTFGYGSDRQGPPQMAGSESMSTSRPTVWAAQ